MTRTGRERLRMSLGPNYVFKPTAQPPLSQPVSPRVRGGLTRR